MRKFVMIVTICALALVCAVQVSTAADLKETSDKLWRFVSGKDGRDQKEVKDLLEKWLAVQNIGNFEQYSQLYAGKFEGVRRTGARTLRFDREGWLRDRGKMFKKPMSVQMDGMKVILNPASATVRFTQTWASGKYKDVGPKEMVLMKEGAVWKISREELLRSDVLAQQQKKTGSNNIGDRFLFLKNNWLVLSDPEDNGLPSDQVFLHEIGNEAVRSPFQTDIQGTAERLNGKRYRVFTAGDACEVQPGNVLLVSLGTPHFSTAERWRNSGMPVEEVALEKWNEGNKLLAMRLPATSICKGGDLLWAQPITANGAGATKTSADQATREQALKLFRKLPEFETTQNAYIKDTGSSHFWDEMDGNTVEVLLWTSQAGGGPTMVSAYAAAGMGCGQFSGQLWGLWRIEKSGAWTRMTVQDAESLRPMFALDADSDGKLEWVAERFPRETLLLRQDDENLVIEKVLEIPYHDCGC